MRKIARTLGLLLAMCPSFCASLSAQIAEPRAPIDVIYHSYFVRVVNFDLAADRAQARGLHGDQHRAVDQDAVGLTDDEAALVRQVAHDCMQQLMDLDAKRRALINARRAQSSVPLVNDLTPEEQARFVAQQKEIILAHIAQLKDQLAPDAFERLDAYARTLFKAQQEN